MSNPYFLAVCCVLTARVRLILFKDGARPSPIADRLDWDGSMTNSVVEKGGK